MSKYIGQIFCYPFPVSSGMLYILAKLFTERNAQKDERLIAMIGHAMRHAFAASGFILVQLMLFEVMTDITIGMRISFLSVRFGFMVFLVSYYWQRHRG